ncbi:MAG: dockerin type I repeat-containing protein, partial [Oscillospiraceae bacterium]|nr:dockerin type I repeat-containing protein [Oscillospiraceae bacterium]
AVAIDGAVIVDNNYPIGDVTQDGEVDNRDLIMIARYLVGLVEFNAKQKIAADFYTDGVINNTDLVYIARAIVAMA